MLWVERVWRAANNGEIDALRGKTLVLSYVAPFLVAPLSLASSMYILLSLLRKSNWSNFLKRPKEQFLVGLSLLDAIASFGLSFSTVPGESNVMDTMSNRLRQFPRYGTTGTCRAQGFLTQFGFCVPLYNQALAVYFVLSVRFGISDKKVMKYVVPAFHIFNLGFALASAFTILFMDYYNYAGVLGCWVNDGLNEGRDTRKDPKLEELFEILFGIVPAAISFVTVVLSMSLLSTTIWRTERTSRRQSFSLRTNTRRMTMNDLPLTRRSIETGVLYSTNFIWVYIPLALQGVGVFSADTGSNDILRFIVAVTTPSQGLLNLLIFTMPTWRGWIRNWTSRRQEHRRKSPTYMGKVTWFGSSHRGARQNRTVNLKTIEEEEDAEMDLSSNWMDDIEEDTEGCSIPKKDSGENTEGTLMDLTSNRADEDYDDPEIVAEVSFALNQIDVVREDYESCTISEKSVGGNIQGPQIDLLECNRIGAEEEISSDMDLTSNYIDVIGEDNEGSKSPRRTDIENTEGTFEDLTSNRIETEEVYVQSD